MSVTTQPSTARTVAIALPVVIVAGCLISLLSFGPRSIMGLFLAPMTEARGWSREIFALSIAIQNIMWGIGQPFAGAHRRPLRLRPRACRRRACSMPAASSLMAWAPTPLWLNVSAGLMIGLGMAAASFTIVLAAFGRRVPAEKRSIVFGIGTAAGSMGQFVFAPFGQALIQRLWLGRGAAGPRRRNARHSGACAWRSPGKPGAEGQAIREQTFGQALSRGVRAPELPAAHRRLLRLRLPRRLHHRAPAGLHRRPRTRSAHRRVVAGADRPLQRRRLARRRLHRPALFEADFSLADLSRARRRDHALRASAGDAA